ncbi:MAG: hypothetical protein KBF42_02930 [Chitinophagales bacterium]|nr:hypothetical protein [Bacteroidota bacterium]MBP8915781.1 hypothetical protein [Chitinophagales bacterium]MBP9220311.1 hypothetical protein [Chitinophagales bacterium]MBP9795808.1 hypothetical protein [Chitinophagales bacterium]
MENLPIYISILFGLITLLTVGLFYKATNRSILSLVILLTWLVIQAVIALTNFYTVTDTIPPRFLLLVMPPILFIILLFATNKGRIFIDSLDIKALTLLHIVRVPVEIVLFRLFIYIMIPELMTFEGRNFDVISGISAPLIYYFGFVQKQLSNKIIIIWNVLCLMLLFNIVINAVFSAPFPFQKFAFDQPNIAILYFPFNWLPSCVVPIVLFSHIVVIRQLLKVKTL